MSDVLIRGMEMPKSCLNCFLSRSGCRAVLKRMRAMEAGTWIPANYRHDDCPLVPVPPHGRLIDADALLEWARERDDGGPVNWVDSLDLTIWAGHHTIIEAEEGIK